MTKIERIALNSWPVKGVRILSKRLVLPGFGGIAFYDVFTYFWTEIKKSSLNTRAKSIAFDFAMAIPAVLICLFTLIPYLPVSRLFTNELLRITRTITPNKSTYNLVNSFLNDFLHTPRVGLMSFGFVLVIFYASNAMLSIIRTFDTAIYKHQHKKNFIRKRIKAMRLTLIILTLFIGTILLSVGQDFFLKYILKLLKLKGTDAGWVTAVRWVVVVALFFYSISFIYRYAPSVKRRWPLVTPGSVLATVLMLSSTFLFSYWVNHFGNYNKIYGSIGTIMILMVLVYLNSYILIIGFELNLSITHLRKKRAADIAEGL